MSDQLPLIVTDPVRGPTPIAKSYDWYTPSKYRKTANKRVLSGLHPLEGRPLGPVGTRCGDCVHLERHDSRSRRTFIKCQIGPQTCGPATDIRVKWRSCSRVIFRLEFYAKMQHCNEPVTFTEHDRCHCKKCGAMFDRRAFGLLIPGRGNDE